MSIIFFLSILLLGASIFLFFYTAETHTVKVTRRLALTFYACVGISNLVTIIILSIKF
ncbi:hypothetical protein [Priestia megaterium]|uniref:hypothetical protein n=1 Tax=Priestia megaterium TaxID=1404 RepID=UPI00186855A1|nr:hypothetical protein [Priestia megaterium]MBE2977781.1 hypothetical protein [Priestia megaterium]